MADHHITLPKCPNCGAEHEAVARWTATPEVMRWHCFACDRNGTIGIDASTDPIPGAHEGV